VTGGGRNEGSRGLRIVEPDLYLSAEYHMIGPGVVSYTGGGTDVPPRPDPAPSAAERDEGSGRTSRFGNSLLNRDPPAG